MGTHHVDHGGGLGLAGTLAGLPVLGHHLADCETVRTLIVAHNLASLEDGLLLGHLVPGTLVDLLLKEAGLPVVVGRKNNLRGDSALRSVVPSLEVGLARKAESPKLFVTLRAIASQTTARDQTKLNGNV